MIRINSINKKLLLPLAATAMLASAPCKAKTNQKDTIPNQELSIMDSTSKLSEDLTPYKTIGLGLILAGLLGASVYSSKYYNSYKTKEAEAATYNETCLNMIDIAYMGATYEDPINTRIFINNLKRQIQQPYGYRTEYKKELLAKLEFLYTKKENSFLEELPNIRYLLDKISSSPLDWERRKNKYPNKEDIGKDNSIYTHHVNNCVNLLHGINASLETNQVAVLKLNLNQLKTEIFNFGVFDEDAFREAVEDIDIMLSYTENKQVYTKSKGIIKSNLQNLISSLIAPLLGISSSRLSTIINNKNNEIAFSKLSTHSIEEEDLEDDEYEEIQIGFEKGDMKIGFKDIGGQDNVIKQLSRKVLFPLKYPKAFENQKINKGVILYGPPGTGKTLLALALANEANVKFIKMNGLELIDQYVGTSERNFRNLFLEARKEEPCIIFLDEFDAIARKRSGDTHGRHDDKIVNQLLTLLSDLEKENINIFVITATNRLDIIDPALLRNGRIGTHIEVGLATTAEAVEQILDIHLKNKPVRLSKKDEIIKALIAKKASGADIASIVNSALENAYERTGIYEKMSKGSFKDKDLKHLVITTVDINKAINDFKSDEKNKTIRPIGFKKI